MNQRKSLTVPGRYDQIRHIGAFVTEGAQLANLGEDDIFHIELACDEACTNIIEHAYGGEDGGPIEIIWHITEQTFTITFIDQGKPFDPDEVPLPLSTQELQNLDDMDELKAGGLGIHFMRNLMDELIFAFGTDRGNQLIMIKQLDEPSSS